MSPTLRLVSDSDSKEHLRALLQRMPEGDVRVRLRDGSVLAGRITGEHQDNKVDGEGIWSIAAGVTISLSSGGERFLDLTDVADFEDRAD